MKNKNKGKNTMYNIKENISIFFAIIFIMSMVGAAGAIETNQWFLATMLTITGLFTGTLTAVLQK